MGDPFSINMNTLKRMQNKRENVCMRRPKNLCCEKLTKSCECMLLHSTSEISHVVRLDERTYIQTYVLLQLPKRAFQYNTTKRTIIQNKYMNIITLIFSKSRNKINIVIKNKYINIIYLNIV